MPGPKIRSLRAVCHRVVDIPRAVKFYTSALGLEPRFIDSDRWAEFNAGEARLALGAPAEFVFGAQGPIAMFEVDLMEEFRHRIVTAGGAIEGERDMGDHGRYMTIRDQDGNQMLLFERSLTK